MSMWLPMAQWVSSGVVYANNVLNKPEFRSRAPGAAGWAAPQALWRPLDAPGADGSPHLALRYDGNGDPAVAFAPTIGGVRRLRFAEWDSAVGNWVYSIPSPNGNAGEYVALAFDGQNRVEPRLAYYDAGTRMATFSRRINGAWQVQEAASPVNMGYDTAVSSRWLGGTERIWMSYYDFVAQDLKVAERNPAGQWAISTPQAAGNVGEATSVGIDAFGKPVFTYHDRTAGRLMTGRWNRYGGIRAANNPPPGAYRLCSVDSGGEGTSLRLDAYDNIRATHKEAVTSHVHRLKYFPQP